MIVAFLVKIITFCVLLTARAVIKPWYYGSPDEMSCHLFRLLRNSLKFFVIEDVSTNKTFYLSLCNRFYIWNKLWEKKPKSRKISNKWRLWIDARWRYKQWGVNNDFVSITLVSWGVMLKRGHALLGDLITYEFNVNIPVHFLVKNHTKIFHFTGIRHNQSIQPKMGEISRDTKVCIELSCGGASL